MDYRQAVLRGSLGAHEALDHLGLNRKIKEGLRQVDVFECLKQLGIVTVCRPLDGLLGAYTKHDNVNGILVSTNRRLPIQRFTAAHELGHYWLKHEMSVDSEESINAARRRSNVPLQEVEAEVFAAEFILPRALVGYTIRRQNYAKQDLRNPETIYQLSLRLGVSYSATRVALQNHKFISRYESQLASDVKPISIKRKLLEGIDLDASHPDVFHITEIDDNGYMLSNEDDIIIIDLPEHSASGYLWDDFKGYDTIKTLIDTHELLTPASTGGLSKRRVILNGSEVTALHTQEKRPWEANLALNSFNITLDCRGKESGLPRAYNQ